MTISRILLCFAAALALFPAAHAQDCNPEIFQAVNPDNLIIDAADLAAGYSIFPLDNDAISGIAVLTNFQGLPPCFELNALYAPVGLFIITAFPGDVPDVCCGTFNYTYTIEVGEWTCQSGGQITVLCDPEPVVDCTNIVLDPAVGGVPGEDGDVTQEPIDSLETCISVCSHSITEIMAPSFSPQNNYEWAISGGTLIGPTSNPATVEVEWGAPGQGSITLTITGPQGTTVIQQCVEIGASPHAEFTAPSPVCLETAVQFNSLSTLGADHFWDFGDGSFSNAVNPTHVFTTPGAYTVILTVTSPLLNTDGDTTCYCQDTFAMDIEVLDEPGPDIACVSTLCEGDSACYWTTAGCSGATYIWTVTDANGNNVSFTGQNTEEICLQWNQGPFGEVSLKIEGCDGVCDQPTTVQIPIISSSSVISGPSVVCPGETAVYTVPKWMDVVYDWSVTGATSVVSNGNQVTITWGSGGVGTIDVHYISPFLSGLEGHDVPDCSGDGNLSVEILTELFFTAAPGQGCAGATLTFGVNAPTVNWSIDPPVLFSDMGANMMATFTDAGTYVITATSAAPGTFCNDAVATTLVITPLPNPVITGPTEGCLDEGLLYSIDSPESGVTYVWSVGTGQGSAVPAVGTSTLVTWSDPNIPHQLTVSASTSPPANCTATATLSFQALSPTTPTGLNDYIACANQIEAYTLSTSSPPNGETFIWSIDPVTAGSVVDGQGTDQVEIQWNNHTGPPPVITVKSMLCGQVASNTFSITVSPQPSPTLSLVGHLCPGANQPAVLSTPLSYSSYSWTGPLALSGTAPSFTVINPGLHSLEVVDAFNCVGTAYLEVEASPVPVADISSPSPNFICIPGPDSIVLYTPTSPGWNHLWSPTGGTQSFQEHTVQNAAGNYTYSVTTSITATGCEATDTYVVSEGPCNGPTGCFPIDSLNPSAVVNCNSVTVDDGSLFAFGIVWNYGDGSVTTSSTTHTYNEAGCYVIQAIAQVPNITFTDTCTIPGQVGVCIPLAADFNFEINGCTEVNFSDLASFIEEVGMGNDITTWVWDFGDGNGATGDLVNFPGNINPTHNYAGGGTYTVTLTVTAANGCNAVATQTVVIGSVGVPTLNIDSPLCVGQPGSHSAYAPGAVNYLWDVPDGVSFHGSDLEHTFTSVPFNSTITVTAVDAAGCTQSTSAPITVYPEPADPLATAADLVVCAQPGTGTLSAATGYTEYTWEDDSGILATGTSPTYTGGAGNYFVTVEDANGCIRKGGPISIQVLPDLAPTIIGPSVVCGANTANFSVSGTFTFFEWSATLNGNTSVIFGPVLSLAGNPGDIQTLQLTVTDGNGCVHVTPMHNVQWVDDVLFTLTSPNTPPCAGDDVLIEVDPVQPGVNYSWNTGATGPNVTVQNAGIYTATGVSSEGCHHSASFEVLPIPDLCAVPTGCYENCGPDTLCAPEGYAAYQWFLNQTAIAGANDPCLVVNASGIYNVMATNANGCSAMSGDLEFTLLDCSCNITAELAFLDDCCVSLSFDNQSTADLNVLTVHTHGEPADIMASPDFNVINIDPLGAELEYLGATLPQGALNDAVIFCFEGTGTHIIGWQWSNLNGDHCLDEIPFECPGDTVPSEDPCVTILEEEILCLDQGAWIYNFTLCNGADTPFDIGYFTLAPMLPAGLQISQSTFDLGANSIAPGDCAAFSLTLNGPGNAAEACFMFTVHASNPALNPNGVCCFVESCIELPPCDSECMELSLLDLSCESGVYHLTVGASNLGSYAIGQVQYTYAGTTGPITQWNMGISIPPAMSNVITLALGPDIAMTSPCCIGLVFYEQGTSGSWLECCNEEWCIDLPPCGDIYGCTDPAAVNYDPDATIDDGSCQFEDCFGPSDPEFPCISVYDPVCGCDNVTYANPCVAEIQFGIQTWTPGICAFQEVEGCTDPAAVNYNPDATIDDGSCIAETCVLDALVDPTFPCTEEYNPVCGCNGMTYPNACYAMHYGGLTSWTQGACGGEGPVLESCPTDINKDGTTNVADLLMVLGEFASVCD